MTHNSKIQSSYANTSSKGYFYSLAGEHIHHVIVVGCEDSFYHDHWDCSMTSREVYKFEMALKTHMYNAGDWDVTSFRIAANITPKQSNKFENLLSSWDAINQVMSHFEWTDDVWKDNWEKEKRTEIHNELDISKWDPRSVLGKLEFDRRAEDAGIKWVE